MFAKICRILWVSRNNSNSELTRYVSFSYLMLLTSLAYYFYFISVVCTSLLTLEGKHIISVYISYEGVILLMCLLLMNILSFLKELIAKLK